MVKSSPPTSLCVVPLTRAQDNLPAFPGKQGLLLSFMRKVKREPQAPIHDGGAPGEKGSEVANVVKLIELNCRDVHSVEW
jgi:hypothetical protein